MWVTTGLITVKFIYLSLLHRLFIQALVCFSKVRVAQSLVFSVVFVNYCLSLYPLSLAIVLSILLRVSDSHHKFGIKNQFSKLITPDFFIYKSCLSSKLHAIHCWMVEFFLVPNGVICLCAIVSTFTTLDMSIQIMIVINTKH